MVADSSAKWGRSWSLMAWSSMRASQQRWVEFYIKTPTWAEAPGPASSNTIGYPRGKPPSFARREPSREGLGTLPGFPSQSDLADQVEPRLQRRGARGPLGGADL